MCLGKSTFQTAKVRASFDASALQQAAFPLSAVKASTLIQVPMPAPKTPPKGGLVSLPHGTCLYFRCSSTSENHSIIQCLHWMMKLPLAASTLIQVPMPAPKTPPKGGVWCGHGDLNPNASRHRNLNPACLPISSCPRRDKKKACRICSRPDMERATRLELATSTLARWRSTG